MADSVKKGTYRGKSFIEVMEKLNTVTLPEHQPWEVIVLVERFCCRRRYDIARLGYHYEWFGPHDAPTLRFLPDEIVHEPQGLQAVERFHRVVKDIVATPHNPGPLTWQVLIGIVGNRWDATIGLVEAMILRHRQWQAQTATAPTSRPAEYIDVQPARMAPPSRRRIHRG